MNVLLIQPPSQTPLMDQVYLFEPLALEYLGAGVRQNGHRVRLHDARIDSDIEKTVVLSPDGVPVRIRYLAQVQLGPDLRSGAIDLNGGRRNVQGQPSRP